MNDQQTSVPVEPYVQAISEQRNQAFDQAAQLQALVTHYRAEIDRLTAENKKLRGEDDGPFSGS